VDELVREINDEMRNPSVQPYVYKDFAGLNLPALLQSCDGWLHRFL
jgi:hypothetical protein